MPDIQVISGDAIEELTALDACSIDAIVTDPPYGLEFMGKDWDGADGFRRSLNPAEVGRDSVYGRTSRSSPEYPAGSLYQQWTQQWAAACLRVLKPGGHLLAFGGTRTHHRLACGIEDAGFEIRDSITWLYGSGFPKSMDVSKAIDKAAGVVRPVIGVHHRHGGGSSVSGSMSGPLGTASALPLTAPATEDAALWAGWGTALKPASEPIVVARKPLTGTVASNVLTHGTGALNIDACRANPGSAVGGRGGRAAHQVDETGGWDRPYTNGVTRTQEHTQGRWPANVVLSHTPDCNGSCAPGCAVTSLDEDSGIRRAGHRRAQRGAGGVSITGHGGQDGLIERFDVEGGASRFFPTFRYQAKASSKERLTVDGVSHPTVKPLELMRWLVKLVSPPGGTVLDPFAGSGTTAHACQLEGFNCVTIEREPTYLPLINARLGRQ